ncbi:hypothetical protein JoomaDRAFT_2105 [Galbibacter orientalis DSM 19592]|uniref:Lipoprotein n=1 Tax=Galbibacter orientalis DSM 19592 TaxID=926559 RepID=I3C656_9FLAO|nr:hypothetical protein [Galbibacter orientalis]EIJ39099.1 hypothetical protein JoomaDRAFT_2105 [Galbibacter orientalis DSM 19592]
MKTMRNRIITSLFIILLIACSKNQSVEKSNNKWSKTKRLKHINNTKDSMTWDMEMLENDKQLIEIGDFGPFELGAYPVPKYSLLGEESFKGLGNKSGVFKLKDKTLLMNSFFIGQNELNKNRLNNKKDEIFFQIIVLTDTINNNNQSLVLSRNHPDYLGQGFFKTKNNRIDYLAFKTADNTAYAIINTKLFDLNFGKTVLVTPQKDKTLRFLQLASPELISDSITKYTNDLIKENAISRFLLKSNNI